MKKMLPLSFLVFGLIAGQAQAVAILQVDGSGFLTGATGVTVDGTLYDVNFQAGSCNTVFNGCDPTLDFLFTSAAAAQAASQALLDQVFIGENPGNIDPFTPGLFDSHPGLTQGCTDGAFNVCMALTPYGFAGGIELLAGFATNYGPVTGLPDAASLGSIVGGGTATAGNQTFAVWSLSPVTPVPVPSVPEPSTFALLAAGLVAMSPSLRRRVRRLVRAR